MANSTTNLDLISAGQASKEATANALADAGSPATLFGRRATTTAALTWGYYGGVLNVAGTPTQIANGTVALTGSATNYVEATTAGVVSANTSAFTGGRLQLYTVVCGASSVTSYTDHRHGGTSAGVVAGAGTVTSVAASVPAFLSVSGSPITTSGTLAITYSGTALPVANGGTGGTSASAARTALGLVIGTDVQAYHARLADIVGITYAQGDILYHDGSNLVKLAAGTSGQFLKTQGAGANPVWSSASGATLADGDYGDITVSSSGTAMTIDAGAVTYAKLQDVSATSRILGRKTAGAGDAEECTLSEVLDFVGSAAQGDILYRNATSWVRLAAGTSGHFLKTQGAGADPVWDAAGGGGGTPGGSDTQIQYNDASAFGGDAGLTFNETTDTVKIGVAAASGTVSTPDGSGSTRAGDLTISTGVAGTTGRAGDILIQPGANTAGGGVGTATIKGCTGANGGNTYVKAGDATSGVGTAGTAYVQGGAATANGAAGGHVVIEGGDYFASNSGDGGDVTIVGGDGRGIEASSGDPGNVTITGGAAVHSTAGWDAHNGGDVTLTGGVGGAAITSANSGDGGAVSLTGGAAGAGVGNADGGDVWFKGGAGRNSGAQGQVGVNNGGALATTATGGFLVIPTCAGTPTGVPAGVPTGSVAIVFDTTNNKLCVYDGGWIATAALT